MDDMGLLFGQEIWMLSLEVQLYMELEVSTLTVQFGPNKYNPTEFGDIWIEV